MKISAAAASVEKSCRIATPIFCDNWLAEHRNLKGVEDLIGCRTTQLRHGRSWESWDDTLKDRFEITPSLLHLSHHVYHQGPSSPGKIKYFIPLLKSHKSSSSAFRSSTLAVTPPLRLISTLPKVLVFFSVRNMRVCSYFLN